MNRRHRGLLRPSRSNPGMGDSLLRALRRAAGFLFTLAMLGGACRPASRAAGGPVVVDDAGDTVRLAGPARHVVSLIPAATELLFAIDAGGQLVGRTRWCDYPAAAAAVPDVGDGIAPNLERIVATHPDLVILYHSGQNGQVAERLHALGIPAIQVRSDRLADVPRLARLFGRLTGHDDSAAAVIARFERELAAATVPPPPQPPTVFILVWDEPPMTIGAGSYLSELLARAGARNVFADLPASSGRISVEATANRNPDFVFTTSEGMPTFAARPEWQVVPAVRDRRFMHGAGSEFSRPGPRAPAAIRELTAALAAASRR